MGGAAPQQLISGALRNLLVLAEFRYYMYVSVLDLVGTVSCMTTTKFSTFKIQVNFRSYLYSCSRTAVQLY